MKKTITTLLIISVLTVQSQVMPAYKIYNSKGKEVNYGKMLKGVKASDILLFGELHDNAISHWMEIELTMALDKERELTLGSEVFERDNQEALDLYLIDSVDADGLDSLARLWRNYPTDYRPLVDYAKENEIKFVGTNIPRRFAQLVHKNDFEALDTLSEEEKSWMAPLPIKFDSLLPSYQEILEMMGEHGSMNIVKAQAMKDATMAHFILQNYEDGKLFIHFNGAFHSDKYEGILWYLKDDRPELRYSTISTVEQNNISKLDEENIGLADFIICVDADVTKTYRSKMNF